MDEQVPYHSQGLSRALGALRTLASADEPFTLSRLAQELHLPKATLVRLLSVLEAEGFVRRHGDPPTYAIGSAVSEIAQSYRPPSIAEIAAPLMKRFADELGFTTNIGVLQGQSVLHLHVEEPQRPMRFAASGTLDETYCTGLGKLLLALLPPEKRSAHLPTEPFRMWTTRTITTRADLDVDLARVRVQGFSLDDEERHRGVRCMAVRVPTKGTVPLSLSISAAAGELSLREQERVAPMLRADAATLAAAPGFVTALTELDGLEVPR